MIEPSYMIDEWAIATNVYEKRNNVRCSFCVRIPTLGKMDWRMVNSTCCKEFDGTEPA
jgi:hypothetical protein